MTTADQQPDADSGAERGSGPREGSWYAQNPVRPAGKRSADVRREGKFCGCGMQLSLTGVCLNCD